MKTVDLKWQAPDGVELPVTAYVPDQPRAVLIVASAMGVPRRYYKTFAADMAARGVATVTFDYRGIGEAAASVRDPRAVRFRDWGRHDLHAVLEQVYAHHPDLPVFLLGHSAGAQIVGMTPLSERLAGLVFIAGPRPHVSVDKGLAWWSRALWWYGIVPLGSLGRWFPARKLGFAAVDVPSGVAAEWGRWARTKRYLFSPEHGIDTSRYAKLRLPLLAYSFTDDPYTPLPSAEGLLSEYPNVKLTRRHVSPAEARVKAIGHAGFFKEGLRDTLWAETAAWVLSTAGRPAQAAAA